MGDNVSTRTVRILAATAVLAVGCLTPVLVNPARADAAGSTLLSETFGGTSVTDPEIVPLGTACLTAATANPPADQSKLGPCPRQQPGSDRTPPATTPGYLRLTDARNNEAGAVLYNRALPANGGIQITFDQFQYGGSGADGIAFFIVDGSANLTATGAPGGSLGYANLGTTPGVQDAYLGVGLDVYGNFVPDSEGKGTGCAQHSPRAGRAPNAIVVRGPGDGTQGYCWLADNLDLPGSLMGSAGPDDDPSPAQRTVRITVTPDQTPKLTVEVDFKSGNGLQQVLTTDLPTPLPASFKFGLAASTGGLTNVHLIRSTSVASAVLLPALNLVKQVNKSRPQPASYTVGDTVPYDLVVTNTTGEPLTGVTVSDPLVSAVSCPSTTLARAGYPGSTMVCTGTHTITADDARKTSFTNTATVGATDDDGKPASAVASVTVPITPKANLSIVKTTTKQQVTTVGEPVPYTFTVTNLGNLAVTGITVKDPQVASVTCAATTLAPGDQTVCTGSHATTQEELDAGQVANIAEVAGTDSKGGTVTAHSAGVIVPALFDPAISVVKSTTVTSYETVGQQIPYTFRVTNTGNVTLDGIRVNDPRITGVSCNATRLPHDGKTICTGTYTVTQDDLDAGSIVNQASAVGQPPSGPVVRSASNRHTLSGTARPELGLVKSAAAASYDNAGDPIDYSFAVTNTGNQTLHDVVVDDPLLGGNVCSIATLAPGADSLCHGTFLVTADELDAGQIANQATVAGQSPDETEVKATSNEVVLPAIYRPELTMVKSTKTTTFDVVAAKVPFRFSVINSGNVTIDKIAVKDERIANVTCPQTKLRLGEQMICEGTYTVTQADVDAGQFVNQASVIGDVPPGGPPLKPVQSNEVTVAGVLNPGLSMVKSADVAEVTGAGQQIRYSFVITNTGNTTIEKVAVDDPKVGTVSCPTTVLAPQASVTCSAVYTVTPADVTAGRVTNLAAVTGNVPGQPPLPPVSSNQVETRALPVPETLRPASEATVAQPGAVPAPESQLPRTGRDIVGLLLTAVGLVVLGGVLKRVRP